MPGQRVLLVDDERNFRRFLGEALEAKGYAVDMAATARAGLKLARQHGPDVVLLDQNLPDRSGLDIVPSLRRLPTAPTVVMVTAYADYPRAVQAIKAGAFHYLTKPFEFGELLAILTDARHPADAGAEEEPEPVPIRRIVGCIPSMKELKLEVERTARSPVATVLIEGESGTGKELVARAIHGLSERADARLLAVNCAAFTETLLMSELFGHERGAFTSAHERRHGVLEAADGGTLFLDEISEMSPRVQAAVLRVLEERTIARVGGTDEIPIDVRVVAATNRDLAARVRTGAFREDLYHRIDVVRIRLPPVRERGRDILHLARHFSERIAARYGEPPREITDETATRLLRYPWPGNVRELRNVVERAYVVARGPEIRPGDLPERVRTGEIDVVQGDGRAPASANGQPLPFDAPFQDAKQKVVEQFERRYLKATLAQVDGNITRAAESAGVLRQVMQRLLKRHDLEPDRFRVR